MPKFVPVATARSMAARSALAIYLTPRLIDGLAMDKKPDFRKMIPPTVTKDNWEDVKERIVGRVTGAVRGILAKDADIADLPLALDALDSTIASDEWEKDDKKEMKEAKDKKAKDKKAAKDEDDDEMEAEDKDDDEDEDEEDEDERREMKGDKKKAKDKKAAKDETEEEDEEDEEETEPKMKEGKDKKVAKDRSLSPRPVTRAAMDSAIDKAVRKATTATEHRVRAAQKATTEAQEIVRPVLGTLIGLDSAEAIYEKLFDTQDVDYDDLPVEAYQALAKQTVKFATSKNAQPRHAFDSKAHKAFADRFTDAARIRSI